MTDKLGNDTQRRAVLRGFSTRTSRRLTANGSPRKLESIKPVTLPKVSALDVAYCVFCKKEHPGGATCMGHYP